MNFQSIRPGRRLSNALAALLVVTALTLDSQTTTLQAQTIVPGPAGTSIYRQNCMLQPASRSDIVLSSAKDQFYNQSLVAAANGSAISITREQRSSTGSLLSYQKLQANVATNSLILMQYSADPKQRTRLSTQCLSRELQPGEWALHAYSLAVQFNFARSAAVLEGRLSPEQEKVLATVSTKLAELVSLRAASAAREASGASQSLLLIFGDRKTPLYVLAQAAPLPTYIWNPVSGVVSVLEGDKFRNVGKKTAQQHVEYLATLQTMHALASRGVELTVAEPTHNSSYVELVFRIVGEFIAM